MNVEREGNIEFTELSLILVAETGFNHPDFPEELKPKKSLWQVIKIVPGDEFKQQVTAEVLKTHHPEAKENPLFSAYLSFFSQRPAWTNFNEGKIYLNREEIEGLSFSGVFRPLAHEIAHYIPVEKEGPIKTDFQRKIIEEILRQTQAEIPLENGRFSFWRKGFGEVYLLDGLIIGTTLSSVILDEIYADAYVFFLTTHVLAGHANITFAEELDRRLRDLNESNKEGFSQRQISLIRLANEIGWRDFLFRGANSDPEGFLNLVANTFGDNAKQRINEVVDNYQATMAASLRGILEP